MKRGGAFWGSFALVVAAACGGSVTPSGSTGGDGGGGSGSGSGGSSSGAEGGPGFDGGGPSDGAQGHDVVGSEGLPVASYDGTTGKPCTADTDCFAPNGPQAARCSSTVFAPQAYYPTPVCVVPTCSPISDSQSVHYCDGPDAPSSPGVCVPYGSGGGGLCIPKCTFDKNGGAAVGCTGKDACNDTIDPQGGVGYCFGGCTQDTDCPGGQKCETDMGVCVVGVVPPTKAFGAACTKSDSDNGVCDCFYGSAGTGYCSSFCLVNDPASCPAGATCDALEYRQDGYTTQNPGMAGYCTIGCAADAGVCPTGTTCTNVFAAGPDCIP